ncbi:hypothetical protein A3K78_11270 [Candidatus Bathyarchaeota archaeon RBG_13_52_12]|nr:MAG: hypothetical protein A3K78_11270 [Candidatus Bathyarchaeota archaeon RBG_13_52_12]
MTRVAVVKGSRGVEPVYRALDLIDYRKALKGWKMALIKVNFITTKNWETGATTDPIVVEAIVNKLRENSIEVFVVESDATTTNADKACGASGMRDMCDRVGVQFINLRHMKEKVELKIPNPMTLDTITVPSIVTESAIINAAKLKTHMETGVTLGMKNMFGLLPDKFKGKYHMMGMNKVIIDINTVLKPTITVIDGFVGMEGRGPVHGNPVKMDTIIAGTDPVATDATAARAMGIDPQTIEHIKLGHERRLGEMYDIEVVGDGIEAVKRIFARL